MIAKVAYRGYGLTYRTICFIVWWVRNRNKPSLVHSRARENIVAPELAPFAFCKCLHYITGCVETEMALFAFIRRLDDVRIRLRLSNCAPFDEQLTNEIRGKQNSK